MALKDWKEQKVGTIGNTHNIIWWLKKRDNNSDNKLELWRVETIKFAPKRKELSVWGVSHRKIRTRTFKTKSQALKFAKSYMRTH